MTDFKEEWKLFKETYNRRYGKRIYYVSNYGRVKCNGKLFKCPIHNGYYVLCGEYLHRIIAEKFLDDWDPNKEVDHKDCNPLNNIVTNLLVCDHKQNMNNPLSIQHMRESKLGYKYSEEHNKNLSKSLKGHTSAFKNKKHTEYSKKLMSEKHKGTHRVYRTDGTWYMKKED